MISKHWQRVKCDRIFTKERFALLIIVEISIYSVTNSADITFCLAVERGLRRIFGMFEIMGWCVVLRDNTPYVRNAIMLDSRTLR
ncbi:MULTISPECIES: hypothetical protein [Calothrix]|uniref:Transposase n=2 Tax=Calothrix TaxID=1186 RepID=A0ABR8A6M2_9CYAN|nr:MULTISPECIES: hypothetical protein [Calothrix]MBD2195478.1 hypothetical protein [Calothrix parietina FACHB-288]MBD2223140.1 hypothetical protein [Calothrix anomala FACHB-343]